MRTRSFISAGVSLVLAVACGGSVFSIDEGEGGSNGSGGAAGSTHGGTGNASGGSDATGGNGASGSNSRGGTGGSVTTGGRANSSGGTSATGGKANSSGGTSATGGKANSTGGTSATGGKTGSGGASGGSGGAGGIPSLGGTAGAAGANSGGAGGNGGATAGAAGSDGTCRTASDCKISTDCCACFAAGPGEPTARCKSVCKETMCAAQGIGADEVSCVAGRCVLARSCSAATVACDQLTPTCPAGEVPSVTNSCWGPCIAVEECSDVDSCDVCTKAGFACATYEAQIKPQYHCVSTPPACEKNPTCACMGVCTGSFQCNSPNSSNLYCSCPNC